MLRLKTALALGLIAAGLLTASVVYAAPFKLGRLLDGGGPGTSGRGSEWFTDTNVGACDFSLIGDAMSDATLDPDDETSIGIQFNAFDNGLQLVVNGSAFNDSDDTGDVVSDSGGKAATLGPEPIAGLQVTLEWKALTSTATMRTFATLQNSTGADITVPISWETNLGSDTGTTVVGSSSGDTTFDTGDRWLVTSDEALTTGDPINTTVLFGPGSPDVQPSSVADLFTGCAGVEGVVADYRVTVPAGQSRSLLFFNQMNQTNTEALAAAAGFDDPSPESELLSGIGAQLPDILNWDFQVTGPTPTPPPPETPTPTPVAPATPTATPSPAAVQTPTPSAAVRAAALPPTGDAPSGGDTQPELWALIAGAAALGVGACAVARAIRRRPR